MWGVLICGATSGLLWERGHEWFRGHHGLLFAVLSALAVLGGSLSREKPKFTALLFALGAVPQFGAKDMSPVALVLWPVQMLWIGVQHRLPCTEVATEFIGAVAAAAIMTGWMCLPYLPLVHAGYGTRRRCMSKSRKVFRPGCV